MGVYYECTASIHVAIPKLEREAVCKWMITNIGSLFVQYNFIENADDLEVEYSDEKTKSGKPNVVRADLVMDELLLRGYLDDEGNAILLELKNEIVKRLKSVHAKGTVNLYGYFNENDPDISTYEEIQ